MFLCYVVFNEAVITTVKTKLTPLILQVNRLKSTAVRNCPSTSAANHPSSSRTANATQQNTSCSSGTRVPNEYDIPCSVIVSRTALLSQIKNTIPNRTALKPVVSCNTNQVRLEKSSEITSTLSSVSSVTSSPDNVIMTNRVAVLSELKIFLAEKAVASQPHD